MKDRNEVNDFVESLMDKLTEAEYEQVDELAYGYIQNLSNGATEVLQFSAGAYKPMTEALEEWTRTSLTSNTTITIHEPADKRSWFKLEVKPTNLSFLMNFFRLYGEKLYKQEHEIG